MSAISTIAAAVAERHGVSESDLLGTRRWRFCAWPRQEAYWAAHQITGKSLPSIGRGFGGRDHTTILHGIRAVEARLSLQERDELLAVCRSRLGEPEAQFRTRRPEGVTACRISAQRAAVDGRAA